MAAKVHMRKSGRREPSPYNSITFMIKKFRIKLFLETHDTECCPREVVGLDPKLL